MKRILTLALLSLGAVALFGCPVYGGNSSCIDCTPYPGGQCYSNNDCPSGYTCGPDGTCSSGGSTCAQPSDCPSGFNCGADDQCHAGDCSSSGCPGGYQCTLANGSLSCVLSPDSGLPDSGADGTVGDSSFTGCTSDNACASLGTGSKCLDGTCVAPANQCSDATQCSNGEQCVAGVCTPACGPSATCPDGYSCDTTNNVCTGNPMPCNEGDAAATCSGNLTCVQQHCVDPCGDGGTCSNGLVCVDGGCIPNQKPQFTCNTDGQAGDGMPGDCATGSICLHHSCYIACNPEAGASACQTADQFNICKQVTTSTGTYSVCGSNSNLGNQCDPTQGINCPSSSSVCIDGYCR